MHNKATDKEKTYWLDMFVEIMEKNAFKVGDFMMPALCPFKARDFVIFYEMNKAFNSRYFSTDNKCATHVIEEKEITLGGQPISINYMTRKWKNRINLDVWQMVMFLERQQIYKQEMEANRVEEAEIKNPQPIS